jgi:beta-lactam-binding protein with PASTA domain/tRNA A-37 threonylcarbamoyl transferase component Bud32
LAVVESTIEGRYQVVSRIATGGMGEVYRAHDAVLARDVAVKLLHPQLAGDRGFVERFRREARAAAVLNHPSIVGVYDWGSTDGTYFMVMEFVPGSNLRTLLAEYGRLEPTQVVEICLQVLSALDHAHGHGIVHRDVKPENILIARDGTVKVADFGLARAYADSYVSQAEGTVTGTVQYLAPEQIHGEPADPRTDLYAVGVVMFELLTGRAPYVGETSLSIAYQHLSGRVPAPSAAIPTISPALDPPVLRATEKDRADRPASARSMREEVARAGVGLPPAPALVELAAQIPSTEFVTEERAATVTIPRSVSPRARRARRIRTVLAITALLLLLGFGAWAAWEYAIPHYTSVPNVVGMTQRQAEVRLEGVGLAVRIGDGEYSTSLPDGSVIRAVPSPGSRIRTGDEVTLIPSLGPQLLLVPDVAGKQEAAAKRTLTEAGFGWQVDRAFDDGVAKGRVIRQSPDPGQRIEQGSTVTITVSRGPAPVEVPNVVGRPAPEAQATLEAFGFSVERAEEFSTDVPRGSVIRTAPPAGKRAPRGSEVTMVVSKGTRTFPMPDVVGMTREAATAKLVGLGLRVNVVLLPSSDPPNTVVFQDPAPGTTVRQGDEVTIYVTSPES